MKTKRLYYQDSHLKEFQATVLECSGVGEVYEIVLDQTAFFPEGGGQSADTGFLDEVLVIDVQEKGDTIYHKVTTAISPGLKVTGRIDYENRFDKMQQHSGEHIVSGLVHNTFGYNNVGFHLGKELVTMDFDGKLTQEQLRVIEFQANQAVANNLPIQVSYPSREELSALNYRSKIEIEGQIRIITIPGYDVCACCAPHVKYTGEIGIIKLTGMQNYKSGVRVTMLCGFRALQDYNKKEENITQISVALSAKPYETALAVEHLQNEVKENRAKIQHFQQSFLDRELAGITGETENYAIFLEEADMNILRKFVDEAKLRCKGICGAFVGDNKRGYHYILGSCKVNLRDYVKLLNGTFAGKGGGTPEMVQGSLLGCADEIRGFLNQSGSLSVEE